MRPLRHFAIASAVLVTAHSVAVAAPPVVVSPDVVRVSAREDSDLLQDHLVAVDEGHSRGRVERSENRAGSDAQREAESGQNQGLNPFGGPFPGFPGFDFRGFGPHGFGNGPGFPAGSPPPVAARQPQAAHGGQRPSLLGDVLFRLLDLDRDGKLSREEFERLVHTLESSDYGPVERVVSDIPQPARSDAAERGSRSIREQPATGETRPQRQERPQLPAESGPAPQPKDRNEQTPAETERLRTQSGLQKSARSVRAISLQLRADWI